MNQGKSIVQLCIGVTLFRVNVLPARCKRKRKIQARRGGTYLTVPLKQNGDWGMMASLLLI